MLSGGGVTRTQSCSVMFYRHCQSHPAFILGQSPPTITPAAPLFLGEAEPDQADQFKSQFARRLLSDGSQLSRADLEKLRQEVLMIP